MGALHILCVYVCVCVTSMSPCATPMDVMKTRLMQSQSQFRGVVHCFTHTVQPDPCSPTGPGLGSWADPHKKRP